jgi:hypothetical protein
MPQIEAHQPLYVDCEEYRTLPIDGVNFKESHQNSLVVLRISRRWCWTCSAQPQILMLTVRNVRQVTDDAQHVYNNGALI